MNIRFKLLLILIMMTAISTCFGQDYQIRTLFNDAGRPGSGGYAGLANKFTTIRGEYANICEVYGGWYVNHRFLIGVSAAALTNNLPVPTEYSTDPRRNTSYQYGQFGLMTEYTLWSDHAVHLSFHVMNGAGFTVQYIRNPDDFRYDYYYSDPPEDLPNDANWFYVSEPGIRLEMNLTRWMRFSPGVSYRFAYNSHAPGLSDDDLKGYNLNLTLKFGKF
jgi:hypothetical protein